MHGLHGTLPPVKSAPGPQSDGFVPWRTCDASANRVPFACEKISASAAPFAAFPCPAKSCPPDTIERPRFYSPAFRERKIGAAPAGREHAGGFSAVS